MLDERTDSDADPVEPPAAFAALLPAPVLQRDGRLIRSMSVSLVTTVCSLAMLGVLVHLSSLSPARANIVASVAAIGPCFALNRRIAWRCTGRGHLSRELLPFWCYGLAALVATTAAVHLAGYWADSVGVAGTSRTLAVILANVVASIVLWFGRFALLERTLQQRPAEA